MSDPSSGFWDTFTGGFRDMITNHIVQWGLKLFTGFGIGFGSYTTIIQPLLQQARDAWGQIPSAMTAWVGALGIDVAVTMVLSAYLAKWGIKIVFKRMGV